MVYHVILDSPNHCQFEKNDVISNQLMIPSEKKEEVFLEDVRSNYYPNLLARQRAIFVSNSIENALEWRNQLDKRKLFGYYIYKLVWDDCRLEWHNADYYEDLCLSMSENPCISRIARRTKEENARLYWTENVDINSPVAEGLLWGKTTVISKMKFDKHGNKIL